MDSVIHPENPEEQELRGLASVLRMAADRGKFEEWDMRLFDDLEEKLRVSGLPPRSLGISDAELEGWRQLRCATLALEDDGVDAIVWA